MILWLIMALFISLSFSPFPMCDPGDDNGNVVLNDSRVIDKEVNEKLAGLPKQHDKFRNLGLSASRIGEE